MSKVEGNYSKKQCQTFYLWGIWENNEGVIRTGLYTIATFDALVSRILAGYIQLYEYQFLKKSNKQFEYFLLMFTGIIKLPQHIYNFPATVHFHHMHVIDPLVSN